MLEYIIRGEPDEHFGLHSQAWAEALRPASMECQHLPGFGQDHLRAEIDGVVVVFSPEPPSWQVSFDVDVDSTWAGRVAEAIRENMERCSGQPGRVIPI